MDGKLETGRHDEPLTVAQVASELGISEHTLAIWRCSRRYPLPFIKVGSLVRYRRSDLRDFLASRTSGTAAA